MDEKPNSGEVHDRVMTGDRAAAAELFMQYRLRLRHMVQLRLDRRLQGRVDPSDVLQESFLDVSRRLNEFVANPVMPFFLWVRLITGQRLAALHRMHLGA